MTRSSGLLPWLLLLPAPAFAQRVPVPADVPVCDQVSVGLEVQITQAIQGQGPAHHLRFAYVGETDDAWLVEERTNALEEAAETDPDYRGAVLALWASKADGRVRAAALGRPGQPWVGLPVPALQPKPTRPKPLREESVTVQAGTFKALVFADGNRRWWVGQEPPVEQVLLKIAQGDTPFELVDVTDPKQVELGARTVTVRRYRYSDFSEMWITLDPLVAAFLNAGDPSQGLVRVLDRGVEMRLTHIGGDAKPSLPWPAEPPPVTPAAAKEPTDKPPMDHEGHEGH